MKTLQILILVTSHGDLGTTGRTTGLWLEELAVPYLTLTRAGAEVTIASPRGGPAPIDPGSVNADVEEVRAFQADAVAQRKLAATVKLSSLDTSTFDAVFVAGGHGVMWDLPTLEVGAALSKAWQANRVLAAVCHGPAALVQVTTKAGMPVVAGKRVAAFTNEEEAAAELTKVVPFLLETKLAALGATIDKGPMWKSKVVTDGQLVTGQNPASSKAVAEAVLARLRAPSSTSTP